MRPGGDKRTALTYTNQRCVRFEGAVSSLCGDACAAVLRAQPVPTTIPIPDGEAGIGFDDLRFSPTLGRLLVPAGRTGAIVLVEPGPWRITRIGGFSARGRLRRGPRRRRDVGGRGARVRVRDGPDGPAARRRGPGQRTRRVARRSSRAARTTSATSSGRARSGSRSPTRSGSRSSASRAIRPSPSTTRSSTSRAARSRS